MQDKRKRKEVYGAIRVAGLAAMIPIVLPAGPLAGYAAGRYLEELAHVSFHAPEIFAAIGFFASVKEVVRILRIISKSEKET
jgi:hypothetical protein